MSSEMCPRTAPFCRLCLSQTENKVPIFGRDETNILNLLTLIELDVDLDSEPEAAVCFDCIVTLEGFFQFKEQCHVNDDLIKSLPPEKDDGSDEECLGDNEVVKPTARTTYESSEEEGLVKDFDETVTPSKASTVRSKPDAKRAKLEVAQPGHSRKALQFKPDELEKIAQDLSIAELDKLQALQDSYPDYFHFERGARSNYYTLVYYGERYNSATYNATHTLWQCANRRRFQCPARVYVTNDYTEFERRLEHTHGDVIEKEQYDLFTPKQALPEIFKLCRQYIIRRKAKTRRQVLRNKIRRDAEFKKRQQDAASERQVTEGQVYDNDSLLRVLGEGGDENELVEMVDYDESDDSDWA